MSAPAIDRAGIERLDHDPGCVTCDRTADYATDSHGCAETFMCSACLTSVREFFGRVISAGVRGRCTGCGNVFTRWEDFVTAVLL